MHVVPRWVKSPYLGAGVMMSSVALEAVLNNATPRILFVTGACQAVATLLHDNHGFKKHFAPRFHLVFDGADTTGAYVSTTGTDTHFTRSYRIAVVNDSDVDLVGLSAVVASVVGTYRIHLERKLAPIKAGDGSNGYFSVPRDGRRYVGILYEHHNVHRPNENYFRVSFNDEHLNATLRDRVRIAVEVRGADAPPQRICFDVDLERADWNAVSVWQID